MSVLDRFCRPGVRMLANAMAGDWREFCDENGYVLESEKGRIPSVEIVVVNGRQKWLYYDAAQKRYGRK